MQVATIGILKAELRRVAYAVAQIQKNSNGEGGDTRAVRAARVYLRALCSFVGDMRWKPKAKRGTAPMRFELSCEKCAHRTTARHLCVPD